MWYTFCAECAILPHTKQENARFFPREALFFLRFWPRLDRGFYKKVHMGLLKAPQVQMLRDAGRSMRTDVSSALRPLTRTENKFKTNLSFFMFQTNQRS